MPTSRSDSEGTSQRPRRRTSTRPASEERRPIGRRRAAPEESETVGSSPSDSTDDFGSGVDNEEVVPREPRAPRSRRAVVDAEAEPVREAAASEGESVERPARRARPERRSRREVAGSGEESVVRGREEVDGERTSSRLERQIADVESQTGMRYFSTDDLDFGDDDRDSEPRTSDRRSSGRSRREGVDQGDRPRGNRRQEDGLRSPRGESRPPQTEARSSRYEPQDDLEKWSDQLFGADSESVDESRAPYSGESEGEAGDGDPRRPRRRRRRRRRGPDRPGSDRVGSDRPAADRGFGDRGPSDRGYSDRGPSDRGPSDRGPSDRGPSDRGFSDRGFGDRGQSDRGPAEYAPRGDSPRFDGPSSHGGGRYENSGRRDGGRYEGGRQDGGRHGGGEGRGRRGGRGRRNDGGQRGSQPLGGGGNNVRGGRDRGGMPRRVRSIQPAGEVVEGTFEGVLELHNRGYGFLRDPKRNYAAEDSNPFVSSSLVEKYRLREGVLIRGEVGQGTHNQGPRLQEVETIDGFTPEEYEKVPQFDQLTAINPFEQIRLETGPRPLTMRVMDLLCPIGKGQRALLVAPPRTGKTMLLQDIAHSVSVNHPEIHLMVLLIDERPEEVTEMRRLVKGEIISSSLDSDVESHIRISQLIIERAKRLAEEGKDVFILLDSITRLARAFNKWSNTGRTATGGLDIRALDIPKKLFGQARRFDEGGSLTVCGTALIDTGSRMDEAIFQEFKGTGNMEMMLSRELADRRIWPSIDITRSGTRREEKILPADMLEGITMLRRSLISLSSVEAMEQLTRTMEKFPTNREFLTKIKAVL